MGLDRPGHDNRQRWIVDTRRREEAHRPVRINGELTSRVSQHTQQLLVSLLGGLSSGSLVKVVGVQRGEHRREFASLRGEPRPRCLDAFSSPLFATIQDKLLEGLLLRVRGEEVFADPILDDEQGVTGWHGYAPQKCSGHMRWGSPAA